MTVHAAVAQTVPVPPLTLFFSFSSGSMLRDASRVMVVLDWWIDDMQAAPTGRKFGPA